MTISATDILVPVCSKIPLLYLLTQKVAQKFGYVLGIKTAGYTISYCHLSAFWVSKGMFVNAGEVLGVSGSSGMSTGPHLHLTTKKDGKVFDPVILLKYVREVLENAL